MYNMNYNILPSMPKIHITSSEGDGPQSPSQSDMMSYTDRRHREAVNKLRMLLAQTAPEKRVAMPAQPTAQSQLNVGNLLSLEMH